jgi:XapX domain-containing protein
MKSIVALLIAFGLGFFCRWFSVPVPAPPTLLGAALVAAITAGYLAASWVVRR